MSQSIIRSTMQNLCVVMLVLSILISLAMHYLSKSRLSLAEEMYRWVVAVGFGLVGIYAFMLHAFFQSAAAKTIGWQPSPFEYEVAVANLAFGLLAVMSFRASFGFRLATVVGITFWQWGDAIGHVYQMANAHNLSPGNAGVWFWCDVIIPVVLMVLMIAMKRDQQNQGRSRV